MWGEGVTSGCFLLLAAATFAVPAAIVADHDGTGTHTLEELLHLGSQRLEAGDPAAAVEVLEQAVDVDPESADAQALLGRALTLDDRYLTAEEALHKAVALGRRDLATWFYLGSVLWENGRLSEAEEVFRTALDRSGRPPMLLHQLGRLLLWQGRGAEAASLIREATEQQSVSPDILLDLARALHAAGDLQGARVVYGRTIELAPENSRARYGLAEVLGRLGDAEAAAQEITVSRRLYQQEQEIVRQDGLAAARIARGRELVRDGRPEEAIAHLQELAETGDALAALAAAHQSAGDAVAALRALERAVTLAPERDDLRAQLNEARLRLHENP